MKRALLERSFKTLTALSLQPPHTLSAWTLNHKSFLLLWLLKHIFQYYHYFKSWCLFKSQTNVVAKGVSPLFCVCFIPLLEFHNFSVWDWGFMENCHLCDKLLFSPIKHRKCAIWALHTIMLSHLRPFESQQGASGWSSVRRLNLFKLGEVESFQKERSWRGEIIVLTGPWKGVWHLTARVRHDTYSHWFATKSFSISIST